MSDHPRILSYSLAINEALHQTMAEDPRVFLLGQGVKSPWYVGNTALGLLERFGPDRVIDTPVSENAMTGAAVGAAIAGMRPVVVHPRVDFMLYAFDPIINQAANWRYMSGGRSSAPVVFWGIMNRGGEQAAQHSQALQALFAHIPGLKVVMPATPSDAKGLMVAAIRDDGPVVFIDDRLLYRQEEVVPEELFATPIGQACVRRIGSDITLVAVSSLVPEALQAAEKMASGGLQTEVIDLRTIKPFDGDLILESVRKTGRLVVADPGWVSFGVSAEIAAFVADKGFHFLKAPVARVGLPDCPAPAARTLEAAYYRNWKDIAAAVQKVVEAKSSD